MKLHEIVPGLFVRGHLRQLRYPATALQAEGINVVVALVAPYMDNVAAAVDQYIWYPIRHGISVDEEKELAKIAVQVAEQVVQGQRVLIHCEHGRNRSCYLAARVVSALKHIPAEEAMQYVLRGQPEAFKRKISTRKR